MSEQDDIRKLRAACTQALDYVDELLSVKSMPMYRLGELAELRVVLVDAVSESVEVAR